MVIFRLIFTFIFACRFKLRSLTTLAPLHVRHVPQQLLHPRFHALVDDDDHHDDNNGQGLRRERVSSPRYVFFCISFYFTNIYLQSTATTTHTHHMPPCHPIILHHHNEHRPHSKCHHFTHPHPSPPQDARHITDPRKHIFGQPKTCLTQKGQLQTALFSL